jgi:hypothetical protein
MKTLFASLVLLVLFAVSISATPCTGSYILTGRVTDYTSGVGISRATVTVVQSSGNVVCDSTRTNNFGYFTMPSGIGDDNNYRVVTTARGYVQNTLFWQLGVSTDLSIQLSQ